MQASPAAVLSPQHSYPRAIPATQRAVPATQRAAPLLTVPGVVPSLTFMQGPLHGQYNNAGTSSPPPIRRGAADAITSGSTRPPVITTGQSPRDWSSSGAQAQHAAGAAAAAGAGRGACLLYTSPSPRD